MVGPVAPLEGTSAAVEMLLGLLIGFAIGWAIGALTLWLENRWKDR